jgi:transmembrane sensor
MTTGSDSDVDTQTITEEAAAWCTALEAHDARRVPEFWHWVTRSPRHVHEALVMGLLSQALQDLDTGHPIPLPLPESESVAQPSTAPAGTVREGRRWVFVASALAACAALLCMSFWFLWARTQGWVVSGAYATDVGEQRTVMLEDGSTVVLDAQSRMQVHLSARERIIDLDGQALFSVAHDPARPFRVRAGRTTIVAVGTEFNVRSEGPIQVAVLDGVVRLYPHGDTPNKGESFAKPTRQLAAGQGASVDRNGEVTDLKVDRATVTAWEQNRLVFSRVPLEEIVREFNKYNRKGHLRVEGNVAALRFGGVFDATDPSPLLRILSRNSAVVIEQSGDDTIIRDRAQRR